MKTYWGSGGKPHAFFDLGTRCGWVVSFTPQPLYHLGKSPPYPLDRRLGGPQGRSGHDVEEKNFQPSPGIEPRSSDRPSHSQSLPELIPPASFHFLRYAVNSLAICKICSTILMPSFLLRPHETHFYWYQRFRIYLLLPVHGTEFLFTSWYLFTSSVYSLYTTRR